MQRVLKQKSFWIAALCALALALLLSVFLSPSPLNGKEDSIEVCAVYHCEADENGDVVPVQLSLTDEQLAAVSEIVRTQRCRGITPSPISTERYEWEISFQADEESDWHGQFGEKNYIYRSVSGSFNFYYRVQNGAKIAAALDELLL